MCVVGLDYISKQIRTTFLYISVNIYDMHSIFMWTHMDTSSLCDELQMFLCVFRVFCFFCMFLVCMVYLSNHGQIVVLGGPRTNICCLLLSGSPFTTSGYCAHMFPPASKLPLSDEHSRESRVYMATSLNAWDYTALRVSWWLFVKVVTIWAQHKFKLKRC